MSCEKLARKNSRVALVGLIFKFLLFKILLNLEHHKKGSSLLNYHLYNKFWFYSIGWCCGKKIGHHDSYRVLLSNNNIKRRNKDKSSCTWKCFISIRHARQENIDLKNGNWFTCSVKGLGKLQLTEKERAALQCTLCLFLTKGLGHPSCHYNSAWYYTNITFTFTYLFWAWGLLFVWGVFGGFLIMYCTEMLKQYSCLEISGLKHLHAWNIVLASLPLCKVKWCIGSNLT